MVHPITLTDVQEAALTAHVSDVNVGLIAKGKPPFASNRDCLAAMVAERLGPIVQNFTDAQLETVAVLFANAPLARRTQVIADLGT